MNIQEVLRELDGLFQRREIAKVEPFLLDALRQADAVGDKGARLTLLNELMGFYRGMSRLREALEVAQQTLALMEQLGYKGSVPYATTLLNAATAYRADGQTAKAIALFEEVERIFQAQRVADPYLIASLYNNLSLACQEAGAHDKAIDSLNRALPLVRSLPNSVVEVAVTLTNRAQSRLRLAQLGEARADLEEARRLFESQPTLNSHYGAALAALGEVTYREGRADEAIPLYERALAEIQSHYGANLYYANVLESLALVMEGVDGARSRALQAEAQRIQASFR